MRLNHWACLPALLAVSLVCLTPRSGLAAEIFVATGDAKADDKNPGTEALPFKTIQPAVNIAKPGDTINVKAGVYADPVRIFKHSGTADAFITLTAWKDDRVMLGNAPHPLPGADQWKPIPGTKSFQTVLPEPAPDDMLLLADDKPVVTQYKNTPPKDDQVVWGIYDKATRTLMYNANGKNPAQAAKMEYIRRNIMLDVEFADYWAIRKLEVCYAGGGICLNANNCILEDCFIHNIARPAIFMPGGRSDTIRRCNFYKDGYGIQGGGVAPLIEDNLLVECGMNPDEDVDSRETNQPEGGGATLFKGPTLCMIFRYNTIVEGHGGSGWYSDIGAKSCRIIGNAFWNIPSGAIYNELAVDDTLTTGNYFLQSNVSSSWCARWSLLDNFFDEASLVWNNRDQWPLRASFMTLRGNAFVNPGGGYLHHFGPGWSATPYPEGFSNCLVDYNRLRIKEGGVIINDGGSSRQIKSLEDIRKIFGWELHGEVKPYDPKNNDLTPEAMGGSTVTYRVPWSKRSYLARPMLSDASVECRWPAEPEQFGTGEVVPAFFWRIADGNGDPTRLLGDYQYAVYHCRYQPNSQSGYDVGENNGARWYIDAQKKVPPDMLDKKKGPPGWNFDTPAARAGMSAGSHFLVMCGIAPEKVLPQGIGYWSPLLATVPGAKITVSMRIRGKDIVSSDKGSPTVWLEFTNETGQKRQRAFLLGKDDAGQMHNAELTKGSFDWRDLKQEIVAPEGAVRMALFFGVLPCKGELNFDDINIKTASDTGVAAAEILPPKLLVARIRQAIPLDLSKVANRALADDADNDGKGGWTDQGPLADMRELPTGKRSPGGVPHNILPGPKSVVVLKSSARNPGELPEKVTVPVGRKFDTIFFFHSAAWFNGDNRFKYIIHYADGKDVELPVTTVNMIDWIAEPVAKFPNEEGTFTTVVETVKVPQFRQGSVYRMEWGAPLERRNVEIKSVEFVSDGKCVPVLLAITGVIEW